MKFYGQVDFKNIVLTTRASSKMVKCVEKLPDFLDVAEGAICLLSQSEAGYVAGHFYQYVVVNGQDVWKDITSESVVVDINPSDVNYRTYINTVAPSPSGPARPQVRLYWKAQAPSGADQYLRSEVRAKIGDYPECPDDGFLVVSSLSTNSFNRSVPSTWYQTCLQRGATEYSFAVFHIYASGLVQRQKFVST
jgi:hypothetical protein